MTVMGAALPSAGVLVAVMAVVWLAGVTQATTGFGFALLVAPVVAALTSPHDAVVMISALGLIIPAGMAWKLRSHLRTAVTGRMLAGAALGTPIGLWLLTRLPADAMRVVISAAVIASAALLWRRPRVSGGGPVLDVAAGLASGALATSTGTNGPPLVLSLQARALPPDEFRANLSVTLGLTNLMVLVVFAATGELRSASLPLAAAALPALLGGWWAGNALRRRIPPERFRLLVLLLLVVGAVVSAVAALV